jgi:hypothetical protein
MHDFAHNLIDPPFMFLVWLEQGLESLFPQSVTFIGHVYADDGGWGLFEKSFLLACRR